MRLPAGHARRLFLGFTCSIMFLVVFALLIAHNMKQNHPVLQNLQSMIILLLSVFLLQIRTSR